MSLFETTDSAEEPQKEEVIEKPQVQPPKKNPELTLNKELIKLVLKGGKTIDEEVNRPFWKFPKIEYPYDHFVPAFLCIFGDPKTGKTTLGFSAPGNILAIGFEKRGNVTRPWAKMYDYNPRIQPYGVSEYINRVSTGTYRDTSNTVYMKTVMLLKRAMELENKFDWILIDGLQSTHKVSTQRMKALNKIGAFENLPTKLLTRWGERTLYMENLVMDMASLAAKKGVILTSQFVEHKAMFLTQEQKDQGMKEEDIPIKIPKWVEKVQEDVDTLIFTNQSQSKLGAGRFKLHFWGIVSSNKLAGGEGKYDLTVQDDYFAPRKLMDNILTSEKNHQTLP